LEPFSIIAKLFNTCQAVEKFVEKEA